MSRDYLYLFDIKEETDEEGNVINLVLNVKTKVGGLVQKKDYLVCFAFSHDNDEIYLADNHINLITYNVKSKL